MKEIDQLTGAEIDNWKPEPVHTSIWSFLSRKKQEPEPFMSQAYRRMVEQERTHQLQAWCLSAFIVLSIAIAIGVKIYSSVS